MDYGLPEKPDYIENFPSEDENYDYGITQKETFFIDINNDGKKDKITRGRFSNITAHGYTFYEIWLNDGTKLEVPSFRTSEGADCFSQAYKFQFEPFLLTKASRPWGEESFIQPTPAKIETFQIIDDKLERISETSGGIICDVRKLL
jgi:hypothetical protein